MIGLLCFVLAVLASPFKSKLRLEAENAVLRHQLVVLRRKLRGRVQLTNRDRWFFLQLYRWFPSILQVLTINPARDTGALASSRLLPILALEVTISGRPAADRDGAARVDPADEHGEPSLGRATHPWRIAQARVYGRSIKRRQVHGQATRAARPGMAHLPAQSCPRYRRHGLLRCSNYRFCPALCIRHRPTR